MESTVIVRVKPADIHCFDEFVSEGLPYAVYWKSYEAIGLQKVGDADIQAMPENKWRDYYNTPVLYKIMFRHAEFADGPLKGRYASLDSLKRTLKKRMELLRDFRAA